MSQFKIWKVVKERRLKKEDDRMRDDEDRDQLESARGREIEANNERARAQWEAVYGDKDHTRVHVDSGVGSSIESLPKQSTSVRERSTDDIEMADIRRKSSERGSKSQQRPMATIRVASEDEPRAHPTQSEEHLLDRAASSRSVSHRTSPAVSRRTCVDQQGGTSVKDWSQHSSVDVPPVVVPLPFTIPGHVEEENGPGELGSMVSGGTAGHSINKRRSVSSKHLSLEGENVYDSSVPHIEDDRASSVAATADEDEYEGARLSAAPSPYQLNFGKDGFLPPSDDERDRSVSPRRSVLELPLDEDDDEAMVRPEVAAEDPRPEPSGRASKRRPRRSTASTHRRSVASRSSERAEGSEDENENESVVSSLKANLPQQKMSKVAMTYRTNEWAKHIAEADEPDAGAVSGSSSPGMQIDRAFAEEAAKPVDMDDLKPAEAPRVSHNVSHISSSNPYRQIARPAPKVLPRSTSSGTATPVYAFQHGNSAMSLKRQGNSATLTGPPRLATQGLRNVSAPLASQPFVESPIEATLAASGPYRNVSMPVHMANNLMDERNYRMRQKPTAMSFNALASTPNFNVIAPSDSASSRSVRLDEPDSDNISLSERKQLLKEEMTLAERKAFMQQQQMQSARQGTWPVVGRHHNVIYDSHQPKRINTVDSKQQSIMLHQWRQSLQQDAAVKQPLLAEENARLAMINQRRQAELQHQLHSVERANRQSAMDIAARSGQLHGAHRDAISKMQAQANRRAS